MFRKDCQKSSKTLSIADFGYCAEGTMYVESEPIIDPHSCQQLTVEMFLRSLQTSPPPDYVSEGLPKVKQNSLSIKKFVSYEYLRRSVDRGLGLQVPVTMYSTYYFCQKKTRRIFI
jgi:hypothetical protein